MHLVAPRYAPLRKLSMAGWTSHHSLHAVMSRQPRPPLRAVLRPGLKRALDLVIALFLLAFLAPTLLLVALIIRIGSGGPALVRHRRVGRGGAEFDLFRFRVTDGDGALTPLGALLYASRIDRLPQLINVLRGELSFVGPRPAPRAQLFMLNAEARSDYSMARPGLTGPWRLAGLDSDAAETDTEGRQAGAALDLPYVLAPSLRADLRILLRTFSLMVHPRGPERLS